MEPSEILKAQDEYEESIVGEDYKPLPALTDAELYEGVTISEWDRDCAEMMTGETFGGRFTVLAYIGAIAKCDSDSTRETLYRELGEVVYGTVIDYLRKYS